MIKFNFRYFIIMLVLLLTSQVNFSYTQDANYNNLFDEETMLLKRNTVNNKTPYYRIEKKTPITGIKTCAACLLDQTQGGFQDQSGKRASLIGVNFYGSLPLILLPDGIVGGEYASFPSNYGLSLFMEGSFSRYITMKAEVGGELFTRFGSDRGEMPINASLNVTLKYFPILENGFYLGLGTGINYHFKSTSTVAEDVATIFFVPSFALGYRADYNWGSLDFAMNYRMFPSNTVASAWFHKNFGDPTSYITHSVGFSFSIGFGI